MPTPEVESATYWLSWINVAKITGAFLVAIGVAAEFVGDFVGKPLERKIEAAREGNIAKLEADAESARAAIAAADARAAEATQKAAEAQLALEKFKAPRIISQDEQDRLIKTLEPFAGTEFDAATNIQNNEQAQLLFSLMGILTKAGWKQVDWTYAVGGITYKLGPGAGSANIGEVGSYDVEIQVRQESLERLKPAAEALALALRAIGIAAHDVASDATTVNNANSQALHLIVGQKR